MALTLPPLKLHLVRHLAPSVAPGVCYGRTDLAVDPALQAQSLAALRAQLPDGASLYSSPLQRCAGLAHALFGARVVLDERLVELDFGDWEMRRWDDIDRAGVDAWAADVAHYRPGGGESVFDMAQRIAAFEADLPEHGEVIVVCHAGTIRLLGARLRGLDPHAMAREAAASPHAIAYGAVLTLVRG